MLVARLTSVTVAPGTTAPCWSVTVPLTPPVAVCALAEMVNSARAKMLRTKVCKNFITRHSFSNAARGPASGARSCGRRARRSEVEPDRGLHHARRAGGGRRPEARVGLREDGPADVGLRAGGARVLADLGEAEFQARVDVRVVRVVEQVVS